MPGQCWGLGEKRRHSETPPVSEAPLTAFRFSAGTVGTFRERRLDVSDRASPSETPSTIDSGPAGFVLDGTGSQSETSFHCRTMANFPHGPLSSCMAQIDYDRIYGESDHWLTGDEAAIAEETPLSPERPQTNEGEIADVDRQRMKRRGLS